MKKKEYKYDQETIDRYKKTIKENAKTYRTDYQNAKKNNKLAERRMNFLREILNYLKISTGEFVKITGVSQQRLSWWYTADDVQYTTLQKAFNSLGYTIEAEFEIENKELVKPKIYQIEINNEIINDYKKDNSFIEEQRKKNGPNKFIIELIDSYGYTLKRFCDEFSLNYSTCYSWIRLNNFKISHIYTFSKLTNHKIKWKVNKIDK